MPYQGKEDANWLCLPYQKGVKQYNNIATSRQDQMVG
jgi:hypothetical protein